MGLNVFTSVVALFGVMRSFVYSPVPSSKLNRLIVGHAATIATLSYAIRFWSKGTKRALFLRHEGFLYVCFLLNK